MWRGGVVMFWGGTIAKLLLLLQGTLAWRRCVIVLSQLCLDNLVDDTINNNLWVLLSAVKKPHTSFHVLIMDAFNRNQCNSSLPQNLEFESLNQHSRQHSGDINIKLKGVLLSLSVMELLQVHHAYWFDGYLFSSKQIKLTRRKLPILLTNDTTEPFVQDF